MDRVLRMGQSHRSNKRSKGRTALPCAKMALSAAAIVGALSASVQAVTTTSWQPSPSGTSDWGTGGNWSGGVYPNLNNPTGAIYDARFDSTNYNFQPNIAANYTIDALIFGDGSTNTAALNLSATGTSALTLNDDGGLTIAVNTNKAAASAAEMIVMNANAGAVTIGANLVENATAAFVNNSTTNALTINGKVALNHSFITAGPGSQIYNGVISGNFSVDTGGTGTVSLNAANTNTATDLIEYGTTLIGNNAALGTLTATLGYDGTSTNITANSNLLTNGAYTVNNGINIGQSTYADNTTGTLTLGGNTANSSTFAGAVKFFRGGNLSQVAGGTTTFGGVISSNAGLTTAQVPVTITGGGTVAFTANNTYVGNTTITGNTTLQLSGSGAISSSPMINIGGGSTFDVSPLSSYTLGSSQTIAGTGSVLGSLIVPSGATVAPGVVASSTNVGSFNTANLTLNSGSQVTTYLGTSASTLAGLASSKAGLINVSGALTLPTTGTVKLNFADNAGANANGIAANGFYELFSYGSLTNTFSPSQFSWATPLPGALAGDIVTFSSQNNQIDVQFSQPSASLVWSNGTNNYLWDNTSANWKNGSTTATYSDPDPVTFNDTGAGTITIQSAGVSPNSVTFNNNSSSFSITTSGSVGIAGSTGITMNGTSTVNLLSSNSFAGPVLINSGMISVSNSAALGNSSGVTVASGAAFQLQGGITIPSTTPVSIGGPGLASAPAGAISSTLGSNTISGPVTLTSSSTVTNSAVSTTLTLAGGVATAGNSLTINGAGNVTLANAGITGAGSLTYNGSGTLSLPTGSTYTGGTTIGGGLVSLADGTALGTGGTIAITGNATLQAANAASLAHPISIANGVTATFDSNNNNMTVGALTGGTTSGIVKLNGGTLSLTGANSYGGSTVISGGTLQLNPTLSTSVAPAVHVDASTLTSGTVVANTGSKGGTFSGSPNLQSGALNGRQAFSFTPGSQFLQSTNAYTNTGSAISVFYVGTQNNATAGYQTLSFIGPNGNQDYLNPGNFLVEGTSATEIQPIAANTTGGDTITTAPIGTPLIYDTVWNETTGATGSSSNLIVNSSSGTATVTSGSGTAPATSFNINTLAIGGRFNTAASPVASESYNGNIGEVLIFNSALSSADRAAVEQYLESKWLGVGTSQGNLPTSSPVQIANGATLDLNGTSQQIPSLSDYGSGGGGTVTDSISAPATLVLAPTSGTSLFSGSIQNGNGTVGLTFNGTGGGTQNLSGGSNYTGPTAVNSGSLILGAGASLGNTAITVASGASLLAQTGGGSISVGGSLNLTDGSTLDMTDGNLGTLYLNGSGTDLKIGSTTTGGATLKFDLGSTGTDQVSAAGSASILGNNTVVLNAISSSLTNGIYPLISASSGLTGNFQFNAAGATTENMNISGTVYSLSLADSGSALSLVVQLPGISAVWTGNTSTAWGTGSNWSSNPTVPGGIGTTANLDTVTFNSNPANLSPVVPAGENIQNITFDTANVGTINLTGNALTLSALGTTQVNSTVVNNETISVPLVLEGQYTFLSNSAANATLTLAGNISGGASVTTPIILGGNSTGLNKVTGVISDGSATPVSVSKNGSGTWALLNSNTYSGGTSVNFGILQAANGALGSGNISFNGGTLQYAAGANQDWSGQINNSTLPIVIDTNGNSVTFNNNLSSSNIAGLTKTGAGVLTLANSEYYGGPTVVNGGGLNLTNSNALPNSTTVTVNSGGALQLSGGLNINSTPLTLTGAGVTASPSGALESVTGSNTYSGNITLAGNGSVGADAGAQLNVAGNVNTSGSTLTIAGAGSGTINGVISGSGGVTQSSPGTWVMAASNTYTGLTTLNAGVTQVSSPTSLGAQPGSAVINSGTLDVTSTFSSSRAFGLGSATSTIQVEPGVTYTMSGNITDAGSPGALNKTGTGTLVLAGSSNYSGGTKITAGTVVEGTPNALGTSTVTLTGTSPTLQILPSAVGPTGFGYASNTGWKLNAGDANTPPSVSASNVLTITTTTGGESRSAFYTTPVPVSNFTASFVYQEKPGGNNVGDGVMFVLQNSAAGASAVGPAGATDAFGGIGNSAGVGWEIYSGNANGIMQGSNGAVSTPTSIAGNLFMTTDPLLINITGAANSNTLNVSITDQNTNQTDTATETLANTLGALIGGSTAYVGITGSTGGASALQQVSNFSYSNPYLGAFNSSNNVAVQTNSTIDVSYASGAALGSLSIGSNTLNITNALGTGASLTMGAMNLSGSPTLVPAANVSVSFGGLNDGGVASTVTLAGASSSSVTLNSPATSFITGSSIHVNAGTLLVTNTTGSAAGTGSIIVPSGSSFGGTGSVAGPVSIASGATLFTGLTNNTLNKTAAVLGIGSGSSLLGTTLMDLTGPSTSDEILVGGGTGSITLGGSLIVTDPNTAASPLTGGQTFALFGFGSESHSFTSISLPGLPTGLSWITTQLYSTGVISISGGGPTDIVSGYEILHSGNLATVTGQAKSGYNGGAWNGSAGIVSSTAAADTSHLTAVGVIQNTTNGLPGGSVLYTSFEGQPAVATDVLVKYTYYGDANLDGKVDGSDYSRIDSAYLADAATPSGSPLPDTGWYNGDFNYDGVVDGSDYTLMDNAFNRQGGQIAAELASPNASATAQLSGASAGSAVPEPASLGLLGIGAAGLLGRRRRRA